MAITGGTGEATRSRGSVNPPFDHFPKVQSHDNLIQRGYLRLLTEVFDYNNPNASHRTPYESVHRHSIGAQLNFQFNPNQLTRSVAARTDTQLWINQSPTQLLQPGIGDMSFGWTMLFNREAEVRKRHSDIPTAQRSPNALESNDTPLDALSQDAKAERLGVIADIMVLDQITGQRITQQAVEYSRDRYERLKKAGVVTAEEANVGTETLAELEDSLERIGLDHSDLTSLNANNSAFLVPNPIRAVFSENFMVDGYVNSVTVSYQKFSPEMIPTVAIVDISMHAIYQGFARKNTTFTTLLELAANEDYSKEERPDQLVPEEDGIVKDLFDLGETLPRPRFGIDHDDSTKLNKIKTDSSTVRTTGSIIAAPEGGIRLHPFFKLSDSAFGDRLLELYDSDQWSSLRDGLSAEMYVGMALRARLKTTSSEDFDLLSGDLSAYDTDDHFFGDWSTTARTNLFIVGVDPPVRGRRVVYDGEDTMSQSGTFYTKSFPVMERDSDEGQYGDNPYAKEFFFGSGDIELWPPVSGSRTYGWLTFKGGSEGVKWGSDSGVIRTDETKFWLAQGFYDPITYDACPTTLTLSHKVSSAQDVTYEVQYQWMLTVRARLMHSGSEVFDTGLRYVYPRSSSTENIVRETIVSLADADIIVLPGFSGSEAGQGVGRAAQYPWLTSVSTALHFDSNGESPTDWSYYTLRASGGDIHSIGSDGDIITTYGPW